MNGSFRVCSRIYNDLSVHAEEGPAVITNATASSKNVFAATACMLEKKPAAVDMLRRGLKACSSEKASNRAGYRPDDVGNLANEKETLWVQVMSWQDDEIGRLAADTAMWRAQLRLKDHVDEPATCPPAVRELRQLHCEAVAQQELIEQLLQTPSAPAGLQEQMQQAPNQEGAEEDRLSSLRHAFLQGGMSLTLNAKALINTTVHRTSDTLLNDLLMHVQRHSICHCTAHTAALDAIRCAQLRRVAARCEQLLQESVRLRATTVKAEHVNGRRGPFDVERRSLTASLDLRRAASDFSLKCTQPSVTGPCGDAGMAPWWATRSARRSELSSPR